MNPRTLLIATAAVLLSHAAAAQSADARAEFEVASLKPAPPDQMEGHSGWMRGGPGTAEPTRFRCNNMSMAALLMRAYDLKRNQISGPAWLDTENFIVDAKVKEGATVPEFRSMLQNLLVDRFKIALHHEDKEMPIYELVVAKNGPKLNQSRATEPPQPKADPTRSGKDVDGYPLFQPGEIGGKVADFHGRMQYNRISLDELAVDISWTVGRPVRNATDLQGKYDIGLKWIPDGAPMEVVGPTILSAIQDQLGLKLEAKKGPVDTLAIDHIEKIPTGN
jgi:uncharacterized protein (TIGR03435 family)